ncbi:MAG: type II toxin-antitoxin system prevent-host-death family antitoxin [Deltaproteobacteria bacterium]|nr:type II toxin-antitoxin system prevent-host-death family antitoxin [Deltaproteobacteria bacterium]
MEVINVHQAKTHLSRILEQVLAGEEVILARNGEPVAKLVPLSKTPRRPGRLKGKIHIDDSFDEPLPPGMAAAFRGELP